MQKHQDGAFVSILLAGPKNSQWYTKHRITDLLFDPVLIEAVIGLNDSNQVESLRRDIQKYCEDNYDELIEVPPYFIIGKVPKGFRFNVDMNSYGFESIIIYESLNWLEA